MGLNQFADMTAEEVAAKYLGVTEENLMNDLDGAEYYVAPEGLQQAKRQADWRSFSPKVLNQGSCGSCWAHAGAATAEITYNKMTGNRVTFSPQQGLDCTQWTCSGGWPQDVLYMYTTMAPIQLVYYPYEQKKNSCMIAPSSIPKAKSYYLLNQSKD